jgi:hypothetical protein
LTAGPAALPGRTASVIGGFVNSYPWPTPEQINKEDPKSFSDTELADYNSAIKKLDYANAHTPAGKDRMAPDAHLTDSERAAFDKYNDDLKLKWEAPISNSDPTWSADGHDKTYDPHKSYTGGGDGAAKPDLPPPVAGGEEGKGDLVVNTEAIKTFRGNLSKLQEVLATTQTNVEQMPAIKPGYFGLGGSMYRAVIGDSSLPGLQTNTSTFLHGTVNTFEKLMTDIDAMVKEYDSAEELSTLGADKLNKAFDDAFSSINNLGNPTT